MLDNCGISPQRLALEWASAAEAPRFVNLVTRFTESIQRLGPLGQSEGADRETLFQRLAAACDAARSMKLRTQLGRLALELRKEGDYSSEFIESKLAEKIDKTIRSEMAGTEAGAAVLIGKGREAAP